MGDELTTMMHAEFMDGEMSALELNILSAYSMMRKGMPKEQALKEHELEESVYDENIERVLHS